MLRFEIDSDTDFNVGVLGNGFSDSFSISPGNEFSIEVDQEDLPKVAALLRRLLKAVESA